MQLKIRTKYAQKTHLSPSPMMYPMIDITAIDLLRFCDSLNQCWESTDENQTSWDKRSSGVSVWSSVKTWRITDKGHSRRLSKFVMPYKQNQSFEMQEIHPPICTPSDLIWSQGPVANVVMYFKYISERGWNPPCLHLVCTSAHP